MHSDDFKFVRVHAPASPFFLHFSHNMSSCIRCTFLIAFYRWLAHLHLHLHFPLSNRISWIRLCVLSIFSHCITFKRIRLLSIDWYYPNAERCLQTLHIMCLGLCLCTVLTLKKSIVEPDINVPYCTSFWYARSLADLMGATILSTVKNAAKFAV